MLTEVGWLCPPRSGGQDSLGVRTAGIGNLSRRPSSFFSGGTNISFADSG